MFAVGGQAFILLGAILGWKSIRNPLFRIGHLAAVALVALEAALGIDCPLTVWEYDLRLLAGHGGQEHLSFIARLARLIIFYNFPAWVFTVMHIAFGLLVIFTYILIPPRFQRKKADRRQRA
jgi:heme A synthase